MAPTLLSGPGGGERRRGLVRHGCQAPSASGADGSPRRAHAADHAPAPRCRGNAGVAYGPRPQCGGSSPPSPASRRGDRETGADASHPSPQRVARSRCYERMPDQGFGGKTPTRRAGRLRRIRLTHARALRTVATPRGRCVCSRGEITPARREERKSLTSAATSKGLLRFRKRLFPQRQQTTAGLPGRGPQEVSTACRRRLTAYASLLLPAAPAARR